MVIDEINEELLKSAQKAEGKVIVMLMKQERLKSFKKMWTEANLDFYQTQKYKMAIEEVKEKEAAKQENK